MGISSTKVTPLPDTLGIASTMTPLPDTLGIASTMTSLPDTWEYPVQ